jgi:hypothetical protein
MNQKQIDRLRPYFEYFGFKNYEYLDEEIKGASELFIKFLEDYRKCDRCNLPRFEGWSIPLRLCHCNEVKRCSKKSMK